MMEYFDLRTVLKPNIQEILKADRRKLSEEDLARRDFFEPICQQIDGKIPKEIGEMLVRENNNPDYTILIHRTSQRTKEEFFKEGLPIAGGNDLGYTTDRYDNNMELLVNVRSAYAYKGGYDKDNRSRCVIMKIPNTALKYTEGKTKPILFQTDDIAEQGGGTGVIDGVYQTVLLPEYILGTVEFEEDKIIGFEKNPSYTEVHNYKNNGLVCPSETISSYREQNVWMYENHDLDLKQAMNKAKEDRQKESEINKEISKQNDRYMEEYPEEFSKQEEKRTEADIKKFSKKEMLFSKFNEMARKIKNFFTKDKNKEENSQDLNK